MGVTIANMSAALKDVYSPDGLRRTYNRRRFTLEQLERRRKPQRLVFGNRFVEFLHTHGSGAGGNTAEGAESPTPDQQTIANAYFRPRTYQRKVDWTGESIERTENTNASVARLLSFEMSAALQDLRDDMAIDLWTGFLGVLATITGTWADSTHFNVEDASRLKEKMYIAILKQDGTDDSGDGTFRVQITDIDLDAVDGAGATITVGTAVTGPPTNSNKIFKSLVNASSQDLADVAYADNPSGIPDIVSDINPVGSDGTEALPYYGDINRSTAGNKFWKSQTTALGGATLQHSHVADLIAKIVTRSNGEPMFAVTTHNIYHRAIEMHLGQKQAAMGEQLASGYFRNVELAGIPIFPDQHAPKKTLYVLDLRSWKVAENKSVGWADRDGSILHRKTDIWAYEALLVRMYEYICTSPNAQGFITGINEVAI